jgi:hypothetical protein
MKKALRSLGIIIAGIGALLLIRMLSDFATFSNSRAGGLADSGSFACDTAGASFRESAGVRLYKSADGRSAWLENTDTWDIRVRTVTISKDWGERTQGMFVLRAGEKVECWPVDSDHSFYIYSNSGGLQGFINGGF